MKERILIYEKRPEALKFLQSFFKERRKFRADFINEITALERKLSDGKSDKFLCLITGEVKQFNKAKFNLPVIATVSDKDYKTGIKKAVNYGVDDYILRPFCAEDLEYKLKSVFSRKQIIESLKKETDYLQTLIDLTHLVTSTLDPQEILYLIVKKISEVIPVTRCSIIRIDGSHRFAVVISTFEDPKIRNIKIALKKYPEIKKALVLKEPVIVGDISTDPIMKRVRDIIFPLGIHSIMVIPIFFHDEIIGTLFLRTSRAKYAFSENEIKLCNAIANTSANALNNAFLFERMEIERVKLEKVAITDYLTGICNVRYFYHRLTEEFSRSERYKFPLSCLMLDIDYFKRINDEFGHRTGDLILKEFAKLLQRHTRKSDVLARYGGEEFIMLLPQTPENGALSKAEDLRTAIERHRFGGLKGKGWLTASVGVASYPSAGIKNMEDIISFADNALYRAKTMGRNKVVVYKP